MKTIPANTYRFKTKEEFIKESRNERRNIKSKAFKINRKKRTC